MCFMSKEFLTMHTHITESISSFAESHKCKYIAFFFFFIMSGGTTAFHKQESCELSQY